MSRYLIVADDFTGANDTGVQLCRRGYAVEVLFAGNPLTPGRSIVIDTESRTAEPDHAYEIVLHGISQVDFSQFAYVIKKVDSTMRGNIAQEIRALDQVYQPELILFAPALPGLGRTTLEGVQRLKGQEICRTELARDPKNPVKEDHLDRILAQVYQEPIGFKGLDEIRSGKLSFDGRRIFVCDGETDRDLQMVVQAARAAGRKTLYVGTAGIVDNLMEVENPALPAFGVVASISSVTNRQMARCQAAGCAMIQVPVHQVLSGKADPEEFGRQAREALRQGRDTILLTNTSMNREEIGLSEEAGAKRGMNLAQIGDYVRSMMGRLAADVIQQVPVSGVFLTGGDTALGVLMNIQAEGSEILREILVGVPMMRVKGGPCQGLKMVTKAGAFGDEDAVVFALRKIREN